MPIIEILRGEFVAGNLTNPGAITNYGSFVSDNTVNDVACDVVGAPFAWTFSTVSGRYKFVERDNVEILSIWVCLPYHYQLSDTSLNAIFYRGDLATIAPIAQLAPPDGRVAVPVINSEISIGAYVPWQGVAGSYMSLGASFIQPLISMIGAPASLNGSRFYPRPFIKVLHNIALAA